MTRFDRIGRVVGAVMLAAIALLYAAAAMTKLPRTLAEGKATSSIRFVDRNGEVLREVRADDDGARAVWIPFADMGESTKLALLAAEDKRFHEHVGVDPAACVRALASSVASRRVVSGASTITMQLARLAEPHPRTFRGKLGEMAMAVRIEWSLDKNEILEQYANRAPFGDGLRGIGAASRAFFDKPPRDLSLAEAATLAAIPRGPAVYSLKKHPERVLRRRDRILARMRDARWIDEDAYARAVAEPLTTNFDKGGFGAPHLVDAILSDPNHPRAARIETTIDRGLQREIEEAARVMLLPLAKRHVTAASVVVVDNTTGDVLAYVGSPRWEDEKNGGKNDGVRAKRQPGSTLKPFVYGLAMEDLGWTAATALPDVELHLQTPNGTYSPKNYDERFHGPVRLREALASSLNVPAVFAADQVGVPRVLGRLRDLGLDTLTEDASFYGPALALGDGEVRLLDLVNAYATLARGGVRQPVRMLRGAAPTPKRVMPEDVARVVADILRDRAARVGAFGEHSALDLPFDVAAKTGTSKGFRDNWTVGFTREVTVGVWVGNFDGSPMQNVSGITGAAPLFAASMEAAMRRVSQPQPLQDPAGLEKVSVCALSGGAPGRGCKHVVEEWMPKGRPPAPPCAMHEHVKIDVRNGLRATPSCPSQFVEEKTFERHDGSFASWARSASRPVAPIETSPLCGGRSAATSAGAIAIRYPHDGARFLLDPARSLSSQAISVRVDAPSASAVSVFVDGRLAGKGTNVRWPLATGGHEVVAESAGVKSDPVSIRVE